MDVICGTPLHLFTTKILGAQILNANLRRLVSAVNHILFS